MLDQLTTDGLLIILIYLSVPEITAATADTTTEFNKKGKSGNGYKTLINKSQNGRWPMEGHEPTHDDDLKDAARDEILNISGSHDSMRPGQYGFRTSGSVKNTNHIHFMGLNVPFSDQFSCKKNGAGHVDTPRCMCDTECLAYRDCCVDAYASFSGMGDSRELLNHIRFLSLLSTHSNCTDIDTVTTRRSFSMIDSCPEATDQTHKDMCRDIEPGVSSVPVSLIYHTHWQIVFRNVFCAFCHQFKEQDLISWGYYAECPNDLNLNVNVSLLEKCNEKFEPPAKQFPLPRPCFTKDTFKICPKGLLIDETSRSLLELPCKSYIAPVKSNDSSTYRNLHCAKMCKQIHAKTETFAAINDTHQLYRNQSVSAQGIHFTPLKPTVSVGHVTEPLMILMFRFNFQVGLSYKSRQESRNVQDKYHCENGLAFDYTTSTCRQIICPSGKHLEGIVCTKDTEITYITDPARFPVSTSHKPNSTIITFVLNFKDTHISEKALNKTLTELIKQVFPEQEDTDVAFSIEYAGEKLKNLLLVQSNDGTPFPEQASVPVNMTESSMNETLFNRATQDTTSVQPVGHKGLTRIHHVHAKFVLNTEPGATSLLNALRELQIFVSGDTFADITVKNIEISNSNMHDDIQCNGGSKRVLTFRGIETLVENETVFAVDLHRKLMIDLQVSRYELKQHIQSDKGPFVNLLKICSYLRCPMVEITADEYTFQNNSVVLNWSGEVIKNFEIANNSVFICSNISQPTPGQNSLNLAFLHSTAFLILTYSTTTLSVLALLCTIFIYITSSSVRFIHGKVLVSLSATLIVAQLSMLVKTSGPFCVVGAIIVHFSWLSAFTWMSVISYDMMRTFIGNHLATRTNGSLYRYIAYCCVGWGIPSVLVLISIVLNFVQKEGALLAIGYGKNGLCFISHYLSAIVFFNVPFMISLLFNIIAFGVSVYGISSKRRKIPYARKKKDRLFCVIYFKMSVVMGLSWSFVFLSEAINSEIFWFMHVAINGLQGVFMFLAFALRTRLWTNYSCKPKHICCTSNDMLDITTISSFNN